MKTRLLALTSAVLFACGPNAATLNSSMEAETEGDTASTSGELTSNRADLWFPMAEGNTWNLALPTGEVRTVSFAGVYQGIGYLDGLMKEGRWMGTSSSVANSLYSWTEATNTWETFIRFGYAATPWSWGEGACNAYKVKRSETNVTVTTPAGTFTGARTIAFERKPSPTARCLPPAFTELTFAPGVGLIALNTYDGKFLLTSATVNGKAVPAAAPIVGVLKLDFQSYTNVPNTIRCITAPCPTNDVTATAKATYTVTNSGTQSQDFQFNTGCQFDIKLVDANQATVLSLSQTRLCSQSLTHFTLAAGQSKVFNADLPLSGSSGQLFGSFTAEATLIATNGAPKASASAAFVVKAP